MNHRRRRSVTAVLGAAALSLTCGMFSTPAQAEPSYRWKISQGIAEDHPAAERAKQFAQLVEQRTDGRFKLQYFPSGVLGDWSEQIEANRMGTLEVSLNAGSTTYDNRMNLTFMPYMFSTWDQVREAIGPDGWLAPTFDELYSEIGLKVIGIYLNAWDGMAFTDRVTSVAKTPEEFQGIKIRTPPIRIFESYIPALGFISTPIAFSETYSALQTGIVDARAAAPAVEAYVMRDALSYWVNTRDAFEYWFLTVNAKAWDSLSAEDQQILQEAANEVMQEQALQAEKDEQEFKDKLVEAGLGVYEVTQEEWEQSARIVREQVWPVIEKELLGPELMQRVRDNVPAL
ncbi:MAG TPA: TRAP transporter substrate-binding protein DctP [Burkholderiaceae bacterium]|nr:TRAP transporter substrate-binding protein DctP [Burkholderiaceae bacterium]